MSKSKEELNELKKQYEELNEKCRELTMEELDQVTGGRTGIDIEVPFDQGYYGSPQ